MRGFAFQHLGACRRRAPGTRADLKVPEDASRRDLRDATPPDSIEPSACPEKVAKNRSALRPDPRPPAVDLPDVAYQARRRVESEDPRRQHDVGNLGNEGRTSNVGSISASPTACPLRGYGRAGTQNDRLGEAVVLSTSTPIPAR